MFGSRHNGFFGGGGSGGGGTPTGWDTMLAQNQAQAADHSINLNGFNVQFADGNIDVLGTIGDLSDGTWQINNDGSAFFGNTLYLGQSSGIPYTGINGNQASFGVSGINFTDPIYGNGLFNYTNSGELYLGDWADDVHNTYIKINDNDQTQTFNANNGFQFTGANYPNGFTSINPNTGQVYIGDYDTTQSDNGTYLLVDDGNSLIATQYNGLPLGIKLDFGAQKYWIGNAGGTYAQIDDNFGIGSQTFNADNGFQFTGGSTISSDGDLSLMGGSAGIFSDGTLSVYDSQSSTHSLTLYVYGSDNGNRFSFINSSTGYDQFYTDGGSFFFNDSFSNNTIFGIADSGIQTVDAVAGFGTMSPSWLLGDYDFLSNTISVSVGGTLLNIPLSSGSGYITVTKSAADALIASNSLVAGAFYQITGVNSALYGGTTIILQAVSTNAFSEAGSGQFFNPKYNQSVSGYGIWSNISTWDATLTSGVFNANEIVTADNGATATLFTNIDANEFIDLGTGDWTAATTFTGNSSGATANVDSVVLVSYAVNSTVFWGGKAWINTTGNVGSVNDVLNLGSTDWTVIAYTDTTQYNTVWDEIKYDYANDLIIYRKDVANNVVSTSLGNDQYNSNNFTPYSCIAVFQWGNLLYDNKKKGKKGTGENTVDGAYCESVNFTGSIFSYNILTENSYFQSNTLSGNSSFDSNTLSGSSSFQSNTLSGNSGFYNNTLSSNSGFYNNTLSSSSDFNNNTLSSSSIFDSNTLSSSSSFGSNTLSSSSIFQSNTLSSNSSFGSNTLSGNSGFYNNTLSGGNSSFYNNTLEANSDWQFPNTFSIQSIQNITCLGGTYTADISAATYIYATYPRTLTTDSIGNLLIVYITAGAYVFQPYTS